MINDDTAVQHFEKRHMLMGRVETEILWQMFSSNQVRCEPGCNVLDLQSALTFVGDLDTGDFYELVEFDCEFRPLLGR